MYNKLAQLFFKSAHSKEYVKISGAAYQMHNVVELRRLMRENNIRIFNTDRNTTMIYRGVSVEHCLGSLKLPGLGMTAMRYGMGRYLKQEGYRNFAEIPGHKKCEFIANHVNGVTPDNRYGKDKANSFSYCPSVALGFAHTAAKNTIFPNVVILGAHAVDVGVHNLDVPYSDFYNSDGDSGTAIFRYQCETLVFDIEVPLQRYFMIHNSEDNCIRADDVKNAASFAVEQVTIRDEDYYQALEIDKAVAFDLFVRHLRNNEAQKAEEWYQQYRGHRQEQLDLFDRKIDESMRWAAMALAVASPGWDRVLNMEHDGCVFTLPGKDGELIKLSNARLYAFFAPLFEVSPQLTLDDIKNNHIPGALDYLGESLARNHAKLIQVNEVDNARAEIFTFR